MTLFLILLFLFFSFFIYRNFSSNFKGFYGESITNGILCKLDSEKYKVINDLLIFNENGSVQIDHVVVSIYGIFVIETKNYKGWIFGTENSEYWTQVIYNRKSNFYNPIKQNLAHVNSLKHLLSAYDVSYFPIVVFVGNAELKKVQTSLPVIYEYNLLDEIYKRSTEKQLSALNVKKISEILKNVYNNDTNKNTVHISKVRKKAYTSEQNRSILICPKCGSTLVERNGRFGRFYGCKNYPNCKYSENIE